MDAKGYIPISRRIFEHPFWCEDREYSRFEAWLDLLQTAGFENRTQYVGYRSVGLKRGQQVAAVRSLAERWRWGKHKVETFLKHLQNEGMITKGTDKGTGVTILTIVKYDTYNFTSLNEGTPDGTTGGQQGDTRGTYINKGNNTTLTGSDSCESTERKRLKRGDCKGGADKSPDWRTDFQIYLSELRTAYTALLVDSMWLEQQQRLNPGIDIPLTLEKACINYWATEAGWKQKKKSLKSSTINWKQTLANAISQPMNKVYHERKAIAANGAHSAREAEKRAGREELGGLAAAILSGSPCKANR